jgi:hypothetical protein
MEFSLIRDLQGGLFPLPGGGPPTLACFSARRTDYNKGKRRKMKGRKEGNEEEEEEEEEKFRFSCRPLLRTQGRKERRREEDPFCRKESME